jgi:hypothetical protein
MEKPVDLRQLAKELHGHGTIVTIAAGLGGVQYTYQFQAELVCMVLHLLHGGVHLVRELRKKQADQFGGPPCDDLIGRHCFKALLPCEDLTE